MIFSLSYKKILIYFLIFFAIIAMASYFFRYQILSNFDKMIGDIGDARLITLISEHWFNVLKGEQSIKDLRVFYPQKETLGYSDTLFVYAIPYSIFRILGFDMFRSMQFVLILFYLIGAFVLFFLLNSKFKIRIPASLIGTAMFILANNYFIKSGHTQLFTIGLVPIFFILIYNFFEFFPLKRKRILYGILAILLIGLITFSAFYTAYFTMLFIFILGCVWCFFSWLAGEKPFLKIFNYIRFNLIEILIYIGVGIISLLPSIWVYLSIIRDFGSRSFSDVMIYLPQWNDFLNVSFDNLIWGKALKLIFPNIRSGELMVGFPFITFLSFFVCIFYFSKKFLSKDLKFNIRLPLVISITILIVMLLILRISDFSLWKIPYTLIPGTSALRAVSRYNMFLSLPIGIVLAFGFENLLYKYKNDNFIKFILIPIVLLIFLLENTVIFTNSNWSISEQRKQFSNVILPPEDCNVFVLINPIPSAPFVYQLDAWMIAVKYNLYTINGYSGIFPHNWWNLWDSNNKDIYSIGIKEWTQSNNINNLCSYDQLNNKWTSNILGDDNF